jgi:hypothetical protein
MNLKNKSFVLATASEQNQINRKMLVWLNTFPDKPVDVIRYEDLMAGTVGMALSTIQGTYITRRYILGGHEAEYQFKVVYRIAPGNSIDKRLQADELLDVLGDWAMSNPPNLGEGIQVKRIAVTARSSVFAMYENGEEDHQILMTLTYEVI